MSLFKDLQEFLVNALRLELERREYGSPGDVHGARAPAGTSVQDLIHWMQGIQSGTLKAFDGGNVYNNLCYSQVAPPLYDVKNMNVSTAIQNGGADCLSDPRDVALLLPQIPHLVYHRLVPERNHLDFLLSLNVTDILYKKIIDVMKKHP